MPAVSANRYPSLICCFHSCPFPRLPETAYGIPEKRLHFSTSFLLTLTISTCTRNREKRESSRMLTPLNIIPIVNSNPLCFWQFGALVETFIPLVHKTLFLPYFLHYLATTNDKRLHSTRLVSLVPPGPLLYSTSCFLSRSTHV